MDSKHHSSLMNRIPTNQQEYLQLQRQQEQLRIEQTMISSCPTSVSKTAFTHDQNVSMNPFQQLQQQQRMMMKRYTQAGHASYNENMNNRMIIENNAVNSNMHYYPSSTSSITGNCDMSISSDEVTYNNNINGMGMTMFHSNLHQPNYNNNVNFEYMNEFRNPNSNFGYNKSSNMNHLHQNFDEVANIAEQQSNMILQMMMPKREHIATMKTNPSFGRLQQLQGRRSSMTSTLSSSSRTTKSVGYREQMMIHEQQRPSTTPKFKTNFSAAVSRDDSNDKTENVEEVFCRQDEVVTISSGSCDKSTTSCNKRKERGGRKKKPSPSSSFPSKLYQILSDAKADLTDKEKVQDCICWLPHGRAWKIVKPNLLEEKILPKYFRSDRYASFMRQVNGWGFKRITEGPDVTAYYHEMFLRGLPLIVAKMKRPHGGTASICSSTNDAAKDQLAGKCPDFYKISKFAPLPSQISSDLDNDDHDDEDHDSCCDQDTPQGDDDDDISCFSSYSIGKILECASGHDTNHDLGSYCNASVRSTSTTSIFDGDFDNDDSPLLTTKDDLLLTSIESTRKNEKKMRKMTSSSEPHRTSKSSLLSRLRPQQFVQQSSSSSSSAHPLHQYLDEPTNLPMKDFDLNPLPLEYDGEVFDVDDLLLLPLVSSPPPKKAISKVDSTTGASMSTMANGDRQDDVDEEALSLADLYYLTQQNKVILNSTDRFKDTCSRSNNIR